MDTDLRRPAAAPVSTWSAAFGVPAPSDASWWKTRMRLISNIRDYWGDSWEFFPRYAILYAIMENFGSAKDKNITNKWKILRYISSKIVFKSFVMVSCQILTILYHNCYYMFLQVVNVAIIKKLSGTGVDSWQAVDCQLTVDIRTVSACISFVSLCCRVVDICLIE